MEDWNDAEDAPNIGTRFPQSKLLQCSLEILELIASYLDVHSLVALSSSCHLLANVRWASVNLQHLIVSSIDLTFFEIMLLRHMPSELFLQGNKKGEEASLLSPEMARLIAQTPSIKKIHISHCMLAEGTMTIFERWLPRLEVFDFLHSTISLPTTPSSITSLPSAPEPTPEPSQIPAATQQQTLTQKDEEDPLAHRSPCIKWNGRMVDLSFSKKQPRLLHLISQMSMLSSLNMSNAHLTATDAPIVASAISTLTQLSRLDLSWNDLRDDGVVFVAKYALPTCTQVRHLIFSAMGFSQKGFEAIATAMLSWDSQNIETIDFSRNQYISNVGLLATVLNQGRHRIVKQQKESSNSLSSTSITLTNTVKATTIRSSYSSSPSPSLSVPAPTSHSPTSFCTGQGSGKGYTGESVPSNDFIGEESRTVHQEGASRNCTNVQLSNISNSRIFTREPTTTMPSSKPFHEGIHGNIVLECTTINLKLLSFINSNLCDVRDDIAQLLLLCGPATAVLLSQCNIGEDGMRHIVHAMGEGALVASLDVSNNAVDFTQVVNAEQPLFGSCQTVSAATQYRPLCRHNVPSVGSFDMSSPLAPPLPTIPLSALQISSNNIGPTAMSRILPYLHMCSNLTSLQLSDCGVAPTGLLAIASFLDHSSIIREMDVSGNYVIVPLPTIPNTQLSLFSHDFFPVHISNSTSSNYNDDNYNDIDNDNNNDNYNDSDNDNSNSYHNSDHNRIDAVPMVSDLGETTSFQPMLMNLESSLFTEVTSASDTFTIAPPSPLHANNTLEHLDDDEWYNVLRTFGRAVARCTSLESVRMRAMDYTVPTLNALVDGFCNITREARYQDGKDPLTRTTHNNSNGLNEEVGENQKKEAAHQDSTGSSFRKRNDNHSFALNFAGNEVGQDGGGVFGRLLLHSTRPITSLDLSGTFLGLKGAADFAQYLRWSYHANKLMLCNNGIPSEGIVCLADALCCPNSRCRTNASPSPSLPSYLRCHQCHNLEHLDLFRNAAGSEGVNRLCDVICSRGNSLKSLSLGENALSCEDVLCLCSALATNPILRFISLEGCQMSIMVYHELARALQSNTHLHQMDITSVAFVFADDSLICPINSIIEAEYSLIRQHRRISFQHSITAQTEDLIRGQF
eukprot:m.63227 g.63227  ORF g.63227 m.63227 type:complete len:1135 (+) comp8064_c0_seq1:167-3571(+)